MYKIEQLTTEGSEFKSNNSGHVVDVNEVMLMVHTFLFLYIASCLFLVFFLIFVGMKNESDIKDHSDKHLKFIGITAVIAGTLIFLDLVANGAFLWNEYEHISKNKPSWLLRDSKKKFVSQHQNIYYVILGVRLGTSCISAFIAFLVSCVSSCRKCEEKCKRNGSILVLFVYAFLTLFQLVPVMCHMVMYPIRTLSIIVQCLCSLFILFLLAYQFISFLIMSCSCFKVKCPCKSSCCSCINVQSFGLEQGYECCMHLIQVCHSLLWH